MNPTHRKSQREGNQGFFTGTNREEHTKLLCIVRAQANSIKSVRNVNLGKVDRPKPRIGMGDIIKDSVKGATKLHGFQRGHRGSVIVDAVKTVVTDDARAPIPLRHHAQGTEA